ncbi:MAG: hypothetical protein WC483_03510 [Candidatus Paceibacterota bacterium]
MRCRIEAARPGLTIHPSSPSLLSIPPLHPSSPSRRRLPRK